MAPPIAAWWTSRDHLPLPTDAVLPGALATRSARILIGTHLAIRAPLPIDDGRPYSFRSDLKRNGVVPTYARSYATASA